MKRYEKYKKVDLPWLKEVPERWKVEKVKRIFYISKDISYKENPVVLSLARDKIKIRDTESNIGQLAENYSNYNTVKIGDLLLNPMDLYSGANCNISYYDGVISPAYINLRTKQYINIRYFDFLFKIQYTSLAFQSVGKGVSKDNRWTLSNETLLNYKIIVPSKNEQIQISNFLDWKISEIDKLIELEKSKIEKLYELKISLHKDIVLNNDINIINDILLSKFTVKNIGDTLYKNVKLGHILKKVEQNADIKEDIVICSNKGISFIRGEKKIGLVSDDINVYQKVRKGQLMIHGMDTWHGAICISDFNGMCTRVVHVCETSQNKKYIYYYLRLLSFLGIYKNISNGVRQNTSDFRSWEKVKDLNILLPNLEKQNNIVLILDEKLTEIDNLISKTNNQITYLEELKQTLISDVVTGKMDIRDIEIPINYKRRFNGDREK